MIRLPIWRVICFLAGLVVVCHNFAQNQLRFEHLTTEEGLSQNTAHAILQDHRGFMWIGTEEGLNRYDGYSFEIYRHEPQNKDSLSDNHISVLYEDRAHHLWAGTFNGGLNVWDPTDNVFRVYKHDPRNPTSLSSNRVFCIFEDSTGRLWIGGDRGLNAMHDARFTRYLVGTETQEASEINAITERKGHLWLATNQGLISLDLVSGAIEQRLNGNMTYLLKDVEDNLWLGVMGEGLMYFEPENKRLTPVMILKQHQITEIYQSDDRSVWVGTDGDGLSRVRKDVGLVGRYRHRSSESTSLSSDLVASIYEDQTGTLWIGTWGGGINTWRRDHEQFQHYRHNPNRESSLSHPWISSINEDRKGRLWVGSYGGGLSLSNPKRSRFRRFREDQQDSISNDWVYAILEDRQGDIWIGTRHGLDRQVIGTDTFVHYGHDPKDPDSIHADRIGCLYEDQNGDLWVSSRHGGISRMKAEHRETPRFERIHISPDPGYNDMWVTQFHETKQGDLWLASYGKGLHRFRAQILQSYRYDANHSASLSNDIVYSLFEDDSERLWIGTDNGLNRLDDPESGRFSLFRLEPGRSQVIYAVIGDDSGQLWCSTNKGLARFHIETERFQYYDAKDGLQDEFNVGAFYRARDGELFFGGIDGLNAFFPDKIRDNPIPPPVIITELLLNNQPTSPESPNSPLTQSIEETQGITLNHRQQVFSIEFAALHYQNPARNRYAYKLDGFDKEWIETDASRRIATYTSLDPGHYTFLVRASNKDGVWNQEGATLALHLKPAPWRTLWAKSFYGLALLTLAYGLWQHVSHRRELRAQRALNDRLSEVDQLKDAFLAKTSHELRTPLQGIIGLCESLTAGAVGPLPAPALEQLTMVTASGHRLAGLVDNILDFSKLEHQGLTLSPKAVALKPLVDVTLAFAQTQVRGDQVHLINRIPSDAPAVWADEDRLAQILYNLIGNAVRFTDKGSVTVSAEACGDRMLLQVEDSGVGIAAEDVATIFEPFSQASAGDNRGGTGLGLAVTKQLIEAHGGSVTLTSEVGHGSCFRFDLPLAPTDQPATPTQKPVQYEAPLNTPIQPSSQTGAYVLVVDDERINRQVLQNHLTTAGYRVGEAVGGREALRLLEDETPDLILLDVMMPDMTGFELCQGLRTRFAPHELPIIFLTAMTQQSDRISGLEVGGNDYLTKPVARDELLARIKVHLDLLDINRTLEEKVAARTVEVKELQQLQARFFTDISHELRTPLTLITGPVSDMLDGGDIRREDLARIQRNGRRLALLVDQLLNISKFDLGLMQLQTKEADLSAFLREQITAFTPWAERAKLSLNIEVPNEPIHARFDEDKVQKIVANLLSNAHKHTPAGGAVMLRLVAEPHWLAISVKDTGAGIPADKLANIFNRFQQGDDLAEGSGIGLSLARDLAILHGGDLGVTSELRFGSTFTLRLPRTSVLPEAESGGTLDLNSPETATWDEPVTELAPSKDDSAKNLLIAEDHPELRSWLATRLSPAFEVTAVANGAKALAHALDHLPDVIISDILMPELHGDELCSKLKEHELTAHIPIILLTAHDDLDQRVTARVQGADAYLPKPFEIQELSAIIENLLTQRTRLQEILISRTKPQQTIAKPDLSPPEPEATPTVDELFLSKISNCLEKRLDEAQFGVFELADEIGISRRQLLRKLKAIADVSPAEFIRNYRLDRAAQLLRKDPGLNVSEVAYATGFKNAAHFATLFKERFGETPSRYV